jgi:adenylate kinase
MLRDRLKIPHVSTGDMLRERIRLGQTAGTAVAAKMQAGVLVKDELVNEMVEQRLACPDAVQGFILDGYPRTLAQANHLCEWLGERKRAVVVIHLEVDYNVIIARLTGRRQCPLCETLYNLASQPPRVDNLCDRDGTPLVVRADDNEAVIRQRLEAYEQQTRPVLDFYRERGRPVYTVDGSNDPPDAIFGKIRAVVEA